METVFEITREGARLMENYPSLGEHCSEKEGAGDDEVIPPPFAPLQVPPPAQETRAYRWNEGVADRRRATQYRGNCCGAGQLSRRTSAP